MDTAGWQDREARQPMRRGTLFRLASMTKPITSVAALQLVDQGLIALSDPVDPWLPELADRMVMRDPYGSPEDLVPASRPITLDSRFARMLLGGGEFDGTRILSRGIVEAMTRDHLTPEQHAAPPFNPPLGQTIWDEHGFGYGVQVRTSASNPGPSLGAFSWPGAFGTAWVADSQRDLVALLFTQSNGIIVAAEWQSRLGEDFFGGLYQALTD